MPNYPVSSLLAAHLFLFANRLNNKLDVLFDSLVGTSPKLFTEFTATFVTGNAVDISSQNSYSAEAALANVYSSNNQKCCQFYIKTAADTTPQILDYDTDGSAPDKIAEFGYTWSTNSSHHPNSWDFRVFLPNEAATTTFTIHFDATATTAAFDLTVTLTVTADPEEGDE